MRIKIEKEKLLRLASTLVRIPSENPPGNEKEIADYLASKLRELGFKTFEYNFKPGRPNVVGILKSQKKKSLMFDGHLDTVPAGRKDQWITDPFSGEIRDRKLYGRGSADMKSSIAAFISAVEAVLDAGEELMVDVLMCLVSDEEVSGMGTRDVLSKGYKADMALVGEPTGLTIQVAHKGVIRWKLSTFGKAAHASSPDEGVNAIYKMAKACLELDIYSKQLMRKRDKLLGSPTLSVDTIRGGEKDNVIPDYCKVTIDRRLIPREKPEETEAELIEVLEAIKKKDEEFNYRIERYHCTEPSETKPDAEIVKMLEKSIINVTRKKPEILGFHATCEMVQLVKEGIPTVIFGAGRLDQAHKANEHVNVEEIINAAKIYAELLVNNND